MGEIIAENGGVEVFFIGKLDERPVVVGGEDFTQRGGSPTPAGHEQTNCDRSRWT